MGWGWARQYTNLNESDEIIVETLKDLALESNNLKERLRLYSEQSLDQFSGTNEHDELNNEDNIVVPNTNGYEGFKRNVGKNDIRRFFDDISKPSSTENLIDKLENNIKQQMKNVTHNGRATFNTGVCSYFKAIVLLHVNISPCGQILLFDLLSSYLS